MTQIAKAVGVTTRYLRLLKEEEQLQKDIVALLQLLYRHPELAMAFTKEEEAAFNRLFTRFPFEPEVVL